MAVAVSLRSSSAPSPLDGRVILLVEDEPLIALDVTSCLKSAGARVLSARGLQEGLRLADHPELAGAVLDFRLGGDDASTLCERLADRGLPFVLHSGYGHLPAARGAGVVIPKPARPQVLVTALATRLR